ncbi:MAG: Double-strand break repair helicase AddA [Alphaproteobacteria bacterium]|nr:Double-strand break repair helicase AddA [Alphaproteobacteria bacterium]
MTRDASMTASDPEVSAWVAANAGAGKTYTLANRVARLLLADAKPGRILCLTFTKAAAAEMQERLFRQLGEWAMLPDEDLRARIAGIGGDAHSDLKKARRLFAGALETPGGLKILTLHAFCQVVLSRFPIEAKIPPAFEVLDDQSAREMIGEARQHVLERAGSGDARLAAAAAHLVTETSEATLSRILDAALAGDRRKLDRFFAGLKSLSDDLRSAHGLEAGESAQGIAKNLCAELRKENALLMALPGWLASGTATDSKNGEGWQNYLATDFGEAGFPLLRELLLTKDGEPRKRLATKKLADAQPDLLNFLTDLQARICVAADRQKSARAADLAEAALTLVAAMRQDYAQAKRLRGVLDYDDLIVETRNLLSDRSAAQWVLYKLDGGIDHVLIDEAQDTSPEQWEIVQALTAEFFAGKGRDRALRTVFAVGDEKQSIFSFQGADPSQFDRNRHHFAELAAGAEHPFIDQPLITSRRSAPEILRFVDKVFETDAARAGLTFSGGEILHQAHRATAKGGIEFWPALKPEPREEVDPYLPVDAVQADSPVARLARQVADRIAQWLNSGARLPDHDAPIQPRDIMILLPRREPFGSEVIRQLKLRGVPVAGADRVRLTEQIAAMDLIALGRFVLQREDDLTLAALLRSPLCGISEEELFALAHQRRGDLWRALVARQGEPGFAAAHNFLSTMLARADYAPPFEFYSHALTTLGGKEKLLARLGPESIDAVEEFLSLTLTHERSHSPSLEGFLDWVERGGTEIKRDMDRGRNEVRVMTVHGAKGLEADIVILPDTTSLPEPPSRKGHLLYADGSVLFPLPDADAPDIVKRAKAAAEVEALKEHRRLLYVALTRSRDRLYVCGFENRKGVKEGSWYQLAQAAAQSLGVPVTRGDGEILTVGTLSEDSGEVVAASETRAALPDWVNQPAPREPAMPSPIRPSEIRGASPATLSPLGNGAARFLRGNVVHALLARLPEIAPERRHDIALKFVRANGLPDAEGLVAETLAVLDHPEFAAAFGPGGKAEVAVRAARPDLGLKAPIDGRLDRLAVSATEVLILDFKTNRPPPAREADVAPAYLVQMALYRAAAEAVFPGRRIVCGLLFTDGPRLLRLSEAILDAQLADIAARLDPDGVRS